MLIVVLHFINLWGKWSLKYWLKLKIIEQYHNFGFSHRMRSYFLSASNCLLNENLSKLENYPHFETFTRNLYNIRILDFPIYCVVVLSISSSLPFLLIKDSPPKRNETNICVSFLFFDGPKTIFEMREFITWIESSE